MFDNVLSQEEIISLAEWLIFKLKIIYGRTIFEGDTPNEASAIRKEWQDLVSKIGKKGILATIDYLLSGHSSVPSFPPSAVEFMKCYRVHVSPSMNKSYRTIRAHKSQNTVEDTCSDGYKKFQELFKKFKIGM